MNEQLKYILLHKSQNISYDNDHCYVNGQAIQKEPTETRTSEEIAEDLVKKFYNEFFKKYYKNIVVLLAAGASMDNGSNRGKSREGLWTDCKDEIDYIFKKCPNIENKGFQNTYDIEGFLTSLILHEKVNEEIVSEDGEKTIKKIERKIVDACTLLLDKSKAPHKKFLDKITARKVNDPRVQVFTTNYDTLIEQASNEGGFVLIDGFSFHQPRQFSGRYFDYDIVNRENSRIKQEESFVAKVFHLYKLHGSLNWERKNEDVILSEKTDNPLVIYPASEKYESSYEQPYFEMMSRFQQSLRKENTVLYVIGFGFQDKHIQNVIREAVNQNSSFHLVIVFYNRNEQGETGIIGEPIKDYLAEVSKFIPLSNVTVLFDTFSGFVDKLPLNQTYNIQ